MAETFSGIDRIILLRIYLPRGFYRRRVMKSLDKSQIAEGGTSASTYIVGVDLGGTNIRAATCSMQGHILGEARYDSLAMEGLDATVGQIIKAVRESAASARISVSEVVGVGMGVPGHHKSKEGKVLWSPNFKNWDGVQLLAPIKEDLGVPVVMGNDANVAALGEFNFGAGREVNTMVMLTLGTGIGGGMILNGRLWTGTNEGGAEIGHTIVLADGPMCSCGRHGCLESLARRDAIVDRAARKMLTGRPSVLLERVANVPWNVTPAMIAEAAHEGDEIALETLAETGYYVGLGVANSINVINPDMVVIGGGIARAGEPLWGAIHRTVKTNALHASQEVCRVVPAELDDDAGVMGGVTLVMHEVLQQYSRS
jgi:glucokinase